MPIYAYRCAECGHAKDVLQKLSDPVLTVCPACGASAFAKQVTAAGFQLKGSGWYVTDFRGGKGQAEGDAKSEAKADAKPAASGGDAPKSDGAGSSGSPAPAAAAPAPSAAAAPPAAKSPPASKT